MTCDVSPVAMFFITNIFSDNLTFVSDFEPLCQVETESLGAICENVESHLGINCFTNKHQRQPK